MFKKTSNDQEAKPEEVPQEAAENTEAANLTAEEILQNAEPAPAEEDPQAKLQQELEETRNKLLYLQADYQNYRRRMIKELADARQIGVIGTLDPFLRVADFLGMADTAAKQSDNIDAIRQGLAMILNEFNKAFDDLGVKKLDSIGKPFDPDKQEAVLQEASDTVPEGVVIKEWCPAYMMCERCIRAAKVVVSTGKAEPEETAPQEEA
ncbi:MAG: nucleotide exchange factor GrpE [Lentisphaeria bacterium]|nr:nucleotide exchange factor GrpE [Lentisphaeria bacterium]